MTGCVPRRLVSAPGEMRVEWLATDGSAYTEAFFDATLLRFRRLPANRPRPPPSTPASVLRKIEGDAPDALIFHVSRCGSTLVARMLAALPDHVVLSEPPIIDDVLQLHRHRRDVTDDDRIALLRGTVAATARAAPGGHRRLFVKLDAWSIFELPLIRRAFPLTPLLFLHRHPLEVLVSLIRRPSLTLVRGTVTPAQLGLTVAERDALSPEEHAAAILGAFFRAARAFRDAVIPVGYEQLPRFVWDAMPGCAFDPAEQALLAKAAAGDPKNQDAPFTPDAEEKRRAATPALIAAAQRWCLPAYEAFLATCPAAMPAR